MTRLLAEAPPSLQPPWMLGRDRGPRPWAEREKTESYRSHLRVNLHAESIRAHRILEAEIKYVAHPSFDDPLAHDEILSPMPEPTRGKGTRRSKHSTGLSPCSTGNWGPPLLNREQEAHLFRKMNYLKYLADRLRNRIDQHCPREADLSEIERLQTEALKLKNTIVEANMRLVISIVKNRIRPGYDMSERVSDGSFALLKAVDRFDFARGNKFSTYATWAILNELTRHDRQQKRHNHRPFELYQSEISAPDTRSEEHEREEAQVRRRSVVALSLGRLDSRERRILASRHGIGGGPVLTLQQLGEDLGISKERVRQIETRALGKLRKFVCLAELGTSKL
jgi:RNA polymerase sigma factor (sigma-70 family)